MGLALSSVDELSVLVPSLIVDVVVTRVEEGAEFGESLSKPLVTVTTTGVNWEFITTGSVFKTKSLSRPLVSLKVHAVGMDADKAQQYS